MLFDVGGHLVGNFVHVAAGGRAETPAGRPVEHDADRDRDASEFTPRTRVSGGGLFTDGGDRRDDRGDDYRGSHRHGRDRDDRKDSGPQLPSWGF